MAAQTQATRTTAGPVMNRLVFVFSLLGLVISGYLWWAHAVHADIPCGGSGGCDRVAASPYARFPVGSGPPVAAYGVVGYLLLAALAFGRTLFTGTSRDRLLLGGIVLGAALGTGASLVLTYLELFVIRAVCRWCVASQVLILAIFCIALWEWLRGRPTGPTGYYETVR